MMKHSSLAVILFFVLIGSSAPAADKPDSMLIQGGNFTVSAKEPQGWKGDSVNAASSHVNLVLYRNNESFQNARTMIRILVATKTDENTMEDLKYDMEGYRKQFPKVQFKDIQMKHSEYRTFSKLIFLENGFHEYVTYLNPGKNYPYLIAVSMTLQNAEAGKDELKAYASVIASVKALK